MQSFRCKSNARHSDDYWLHIARAKKGFKRERMVESVLVSFFFIAGSCQTDKSKMAGLNVLCNNKKYLRVKGEVSNVDIASGSKYPTRFPMQVTVVG